MESFGFDEESQEVRATPELVDGRVYAAPDAYILGRKLVNSTEVRLAFEGLTLTASAGCREAQGPYSIRKGFLRAPNLDLTGRRCSKELSDQETWLLELLRGPIHADLSSEEAHVLYIGNQKISLEMGALELDEPDQGRLRSEGWLLNQVRFAGTPGSVPAVVPVPGLSEYKKRMPFANSIPALTMFDGNKFSFSTPCGFVLGDFSFDETLIDFKRTNQSQDSCNRRIEGFHSKIAPLFNGSFEYRFDGADLVLSKDGKVLRFFSG